MSVKLYGSEDETMKDCKIGDPRTHVRRVKTSTSGGNTLDKSNGREAL